MDTVRSSPDDIVGVGGSLMKTFDEIETSETGEVGSDEERKLVGMMIGGSRARKRLRRLLLAKLIRSSGEEEGEEGEAEEGDEGGEGRQLVRLLIGSRMLRRARIRRLLLAEILRSRGSGEEEEEGEDEDEGDDETRGDERKLVRLIVGSRMLRRRRFRKALLAAVLRGGAQGSEMEEDEDEGEDEEGGNGEASGVSERKLAALLIGRRLHRRRLRRALIAHLVRNSEEVEA